MKIEPKVEAGRIHQGLYASKAGEPYGAFKLHGPCGVELVIMVLGAGGVCGSVHAARGGLHQLSSPYVAYVAIDQGAVSDAAEDIGVMAARDDSNWHGRPPSATCKRSLRLLPRLLPRPGRHAVSRDGRRLRQL